MPLLNYVDFRNGWGKMDTQTDSSYIKYSYEISLWKINIETKHYTYNLPMKSWFFSLNLVFTTLPLTNNSLHWSFLLNNPFFLVLLLSSVQVPCLYPMARKIIVLRHSEVVWCFWTGSSISWVFLFHSHSLLIPLFIE